MIAIVPYCEIDGVRTFADSEIKDIYGRMEMNGTVDKVFVDEQITSAEEFLQAMKYGENQLYVLLDENNIIAIAWINRFEGKTARLHFCFIDLEYKGKVAVGKQLVQEILNAKNDKNEYVFDMLTGVVPEENKTACEYVQAVGLVKVGILPLGSYNRFKRESEPAMIGYLTRGSVK